MNPEDEPAFAPAADPASADGENLESMVRRFHQETGYPTDKDKEQKQLREEWAEKLQPENVNVNTFTRIDLTAVDHHGTFGTPHYLVRPEPSWQGSGWLQKMDDETYRRVIENIRYLCWSDDELAERYGALYEPDGPRKVSHFAAQVISKLLAICHPKLWLPIGVQIKNNGRERMLDKLRLPRPRGDTEGHLVVDANNRLRDHLAPHFDDDLYGMARFLYWLLEQEDTPNGPLEPNGPDLAGLAEELLVDVGFLEDIVDLLEDKGQVILYGPPGTGKTYLARALAKALAPDESCRALVQFHPSTSYEDFFEGYRPVGNTEDGSIGYELTPGPLARMAERASEASGERHVMVIDEINRGNLPRVLGELLFLLEYRDESIHPLYRPGTPFSLPENLWFIGTMNTADRSIALVDAALRRRFHFVPFFPNRPPIDGLLKRWLKREGQLAWIRRLVDAVNDELKVDLEGSHLLLGPSHFMKDYGSTLDEQQQRLRRIWEYNIEPFIEDQFFGDPDRIGHYRFASVYARHGPAADPAGEADAGAEDATQAAATRPSSDDAAEDV
ncbi:MAG: AAA family ATPase [bacterium]|nr:AAA family ATPase [bacterium]